MRGGNIMELRDLETELVKLMEEKASIKKPILNNIAWIIIVVGAILFIVTPNGYFWILLGGMLMIAGGLVGWIFAHDIEKKRHSEVDKKIKAIQKKIDKAKQEQP